MTSAASTEKNKNAELKSPQLSTKSSRTSISFITNEHDNQKGVKRVKLSRPIEEEEEEEDEDEVKGQVKSENDDDNEDDDVNDHKNCNNNEDDNDDPMEEDTQDIEVKSGKEPVIAQGSEQPSKPELVPNMTLGEFIYTYLKGPSTMQLSINALLAELISTREAFGDSKADLKDIKGPYSQLSNYELIVKELSETRSETERLKLDLERLKKDHFEKMQLMEYKVDQLSRFLFDQQRGTGDANPQFPPPTIAFYPQQQQYSHIPPQQQQQHPQQQFMAPQLSMPPPPPPPPPQFQQLNIPGQVKSEGVEKYSHQQFAQNLAPPSSQSALSQQQLLQQQIFASHQQQQHQQQQSQSLLSQMSSSRSNTPSHLTPLPPLQVSDYQQTPGQVQRQPSQPQPQQPPPPPGQLALSHPNSQELSYNSGAPEMYSAPSAVGSPQQPLPSPSQLSRESDSPGGYKTYRYALLKQITSIRQIWQEYAYGLNGQPSVKSLQIKYKTKWRFPEDASTFKRRKRIYKAIEIAMLNGLTEDEAITELENHRLDKEGNYRRSLQWLCDNIPDKFKGV